MRWTTRHRSEYSQLSQHGGQEVDEPLIDKERSAQASTLFSPAKFTINWPAWALAGVLACTTINVILAAIPLTEFLSTRSSRQSTLSRPSLYIGLDKLHRNHTDYPTVYNYPRLLSPISEVNPSTVFTADDRRWMSPQGMVYPELNHFWVAPQVSSVAQFRVMDYGMERCKLAVVLPTVGTPAQGNRSFELSGHGEAVRVEIWELAAEEVVDDRSLSWNTRPKRSRRHGMLSIEAGMTSVGPEFSCASRSVQSFEFVCQDADCLLDIWQDTRPPRLGLMIMQDSSL